MQNNVCNSETEPLKQTKTKQRMSKNAPINNNISNNNGGSSLFEKETITKEDLKSFVLFSSEDAKAMNIDHVLDVPELECDLFLKLLNREPILRRLLLGNDDVFENTREDMNGFSIFQEMRNWSRVCFVLLKIFSNFLFYVWNLFYFFFFLFSL